MSTRARVLSDFVSMGLRRRARTPELVIQIPKGHTGQKILGLCPFLLSQKANGGELLHLSCIHYSS
jgi:hypothetical protein